MPESIRTLDDKKKIWRLYDFKSTREVDTYKFLSSKIQMQIDCQKEESRRLYIALYSENMGRGDVVGTFNMPYTWEPIIPETVNQTLWSVVCSGVEQKDEELDAKTERLKKELQAEERSRLQKLAYALTATKRNLIAEYKAKILAKIKTKLVLPPDLPNDPVAEFDVTLFSDGEISSVKLRNSSGFRSFDEAAKRAIILARPLPLPKDKSLFPNFRNLGIKVHYYKTPER